MHAVMDNGGQVLVAGDVQREGFPHLDERLVTSGLRPAVGVEIDVEPVVSPAVQVCAASEDRLRKHRLHVTVVPVGGPLPQERELALAQQFRLGDIESLRIGS